MQATDGKSAAAIDRSQGTVSLIPLVRERAGKGNRGWIGREKYEEQRKNMKNGGGVLSLGIGFLLLQSCLPQAPVLSLRITGVIPSHARRRLA
jgi:hypothetical protein